MIASIRRGANSEELRLKLKGVRLKDTTINESNNSAPLSTGNNKDKKTNQDTYTMNPFFEVFSRSEGVDGFINW